MISVTNFIKILHSLRERFSRPNIAPTATIASALFIFCATSNAATSVTRDGVTWKLDKDYPVGVFANGDPYVVAPNGLTIVSITPQWDGVKNGTLVNPKPVGRSHGLDTRVKNVVYNADLNKGDDLPLNVSTNSSIVSSVGRETKSSSRRTWMDAVEVLTVLPEAPPANSFRPPYAGTDKSIRGQVSDIDWSWVKDLAHPSDVRSPDPAFGNVQLDLIMNWQTSELKTENTEHTYGRGIAYEVATSLLWLHLSNTKEKKTPTMINLIQRGIDTFGIVKSIDNGFMPNGGHCHGRKLPVLVAARALNDSEIMSYSTSLVPGDLERRRWQEDGQHFYVQQWQIGRQPPQADRPPYEQSHLGMPDWTSNAITELNGATPAWYGFKGSGYRLINGAPNVGQVIAAEISGLRDDWDWEPFFDYIEDEFWPNMQGKISYSNNSIYPFHAQMWNMYKDGDFTHTAPPSPPPSSQVESPTISPAGGSFLGAQTVELNASTTGAEIYYTLDRSMPSESSTRYTGPFTLEESSTVRAIAATSEDGASDVVSAEYSINEFTATEDWANIELASLSQTSEISFRATPYSSNIDTVFGFAGQVSDAYSQLACIVRFNSDGYIDARDGGTYTAVNQVAYAPGVTYTFLVKIDKTDKTYTVQVRDGDDNQTLIADSYAYRTGAIATSDITHFVTRSVNDEPSHIENIKTINYEQAVLNIQIPDIAMLPEGGNYPALALEVSLSSDQEEALLYYTLDGSDPEPGNEATFLFEDSLVLNDTCHVKAIAVGDDGITSEVCSQLYTVNEYDSNNDWTSVAISGDGEKISLSMLVTPTAEAVDSVIGLSSAAANDYSDLACIIRFNKSGKIDARDGDEYRAISEASYSPDATYVIQVLVDLAEKKYYAAATNPEGEVFSIAHGFNFRTEQIETSDISYFNTRTLDPGLVKIASLSLEDSLLSPSAPSNLTLSYNDPRD